MRNVVYFGVLHIEMYIGKNQLLKLSIALKVFFIFYFKTSVCSV